MPTISLCMIVKNEEETLPRCLDSVQSAADEIIIVDTGSFDHTAEAAARYTDKIYDFKWIDDFSAARNFAYSKAAMDYQLWLDADDILLSGDLEKLLELKEYLTTDIDMVTMRYNLSPDESGRPALTSVRERLTKTSLRCRWIEPVHECIPLSGNIMYSDIAVTHMRPPGKSAGDRNLRIYEALENSGHTLNPRQQYYYARELKDHGQFERAVPYFERFLDGGMGWAEDNIAACQCLAICQAQTGQSEKIPCTLLRSMEYDTPRPEICCEAGYYHMRREEYARALRWFQRAMASAGTGSLGFVSPDCAGFVPSIESCVCCCALGDYARAAEYNKAAGTFKPGHPSIKHNEEYLRSVGQ